MFPKPWSTNGKCIFDANHQEIFSVGDEYTSLGVAALAEVLAYIVESVNSEHTKI